ncbi:hypothetical protein [Mycolicibacterium fallax]|uniref:Uncharacterized protein n=1 Tax=Mycolicibacterium fallax TaxID=1793 RepID=A0A1X1RK37_MYCFA|nr:hypothetical protein [Mycolicibacterium fallax]ORV08052.1 hypothetical protein AWC04_02620 [Mycolicibacterium fallax]
MSTIPHLGDPADREPDVTLLEEHVQSRLRELGLSVLAASKLGIVSRSTLTALGRGRIPTRATLAKFDDLLSWEPGSAQGALYGKTPIRREKTEPDDPAALSVRAPTEDEKDSLDYENLLTHIDRRLHQLRMSKTQLAEIGGPGRSTLATLGKRGYLPTPDTLRRIEIPLQWEAGSALIALRGGNPIPRGGFTIQFHPAKTNLATAVDRLKGFKARLNRTQQGLDQMRSDVDTCISHIERVMADLDVDPLHDLASGTGAPDEGAAGQEDNS